MKLILTAALFFLCACGWPIDPSQMPGVLQALANDTASGCLSVSGRGGAATVATPMPVVPGGGYGSGEIMFARVNSPGTKVALTINGATCVIEREADSMVATTPDGNRLFTTKP